MTNAQQTIRAILIEPLTKSVKLIDMPRDFEAMKRDLLKCDMADAVRLGGGIVAWIDEEGMLKDWDAQGFTQFGADLTLAGNIVLTSENAQGDMTSLPNEFTPFIAKSVISFIDAQNVRVPGTTMTTWDEAGKARIEHIGPAELTYNDH